MTQKINQHPWGETIPSALAERAEALALELASHSGLRPVVMGWVAMELATQWYRREMPLDGDGAPIILLPRLSRWLVLKLGESDAVFVFSNREGGVVRARALASSQGVAFVAIGPSGGVTDRVAASREWSDADFDAEPREALEEHEPAESIPAPMFPLEIRIEKQGRRYALLVGDAVIATATSKARALRKADLLRQDPDIIDAQSPPLEAH